MDTNDDDFAPIPGLPGPLPPGESLLWQGSPDWRVLLKRPFHTWTVAWYFVALVALQVVVSWSSGTALAEGARGLVMTAIAGLVAVAILTLLAWATARVTIYSITSERVMIRFGIALPITLNLPFRRIVSADLRRGAQGHGDIPLKLAEGTGLGYLTLWPHARPWRLREPEPMLRALPDAPAVATLLADAVARHADRRNGPETAGSIAPVEVGPESTGPVDRGNLNPGALVGSHGTPS